MILIALFCATCFLAYSNGANDDFKGVASLYGCRATSYRTAISWATVTTFAGSIAAIFLAQALLTKPSVMAVMLPGTTGEPGKAPAWYLSSTSAAVILPSAAAMTTTSLAIALSLLDSLTRSWWLSHAGNGYRQRDSID